MLRVGVIDSGIPQSSNLTVANARDFTGADTQFDKLGHGSAVTNIIGANSATEIISARVFDDNLLSSPKTIASAIEWLITMKVDIINMSFGLRHDRTVLAIACREALRKKILLVAAAPSQGAPVYPSNYPKVIRATGDARCNPGEISWLDSAQADFGGFPGDPKQRLAGASIGCAWLTAHIAQTCQQGILTDLTAVVQQLASASNYQGSEQHILTRFKS